MGFVYIGIGWVVVAFFVGIGFGWLLKRASNQSKELRDQADELGRR